MGCDHVVVRCSSSSKRLKEEIPQLKQREEQQEGEEIRVLHLHIVGELVLEKLRPYSRDYFRFGAVCKPWFSILMEDRHRRRTQALHHRRLVPLLLIPVPTPTPTFTVSLSRLFSVTENKLFMDDDENDDLTLSCCCDEADSITNPYVKNMKHVVIKYYCGSSFGWLCFVLQSYEMILYNPFVNQSIRLPPIMEEFDFRKRYPIGDYPRYYYWEDVYQILHSHDYMGYQYSVHKVVLSSDPRANPDFVLVAALYSWTHRLAFFKFEPKQHSPCTTRTLDLGFPSWTYLEQDGVEHPHRRPCGFVDVIFGHQGLVYAFNESINTLFVVQLLDDDGNLRPLIKATATIFINFIPKPTNQGGRFLCTKWYVSELSSTHEILLILRLMYCTSAGQRSTRKFGVFKLTKVEDDRYRFVEVKSLNGEALFLGGDSQSPSINAGACMGCQPNSIYFTDDFPLDPLRYEPYGHYGPHDMGVFNLDTGKKTKHYIPDRKDKHLPPPIWLLPMF